MVDPLSFRRPWFGLLGNVTWTLTLDLCDLRAFGRSRWWWALRKHLRREFRDIRPNDLARAVQGPSPESLAFGETPLLSMLRVLEASELSPGARLVDIGCGRGNIVLAASCLGYQAVGLEYFAEYVERTRRVASALEVNPELRSGDFLDGPLPAGDLYFTASTAFGERTREALLDLLEGVPVGARVAALDWVLDSDRFRQDRQFCVPVGWGVAVVCLHTRV